MSERINRLWAYQLQPALADALQSISKAVAGSDLDPRLNHLLHIRASQINHCAFCLEMHNREARESGEQQGRLDMLAAWRQATCFDARERAALALCEALTRLPTAGVPDEVYVPLQQHFSEAEIVNLVASISVINSWNRLVATLQFVPGWQNEPS